MQGGHLLLHQHHRGLIIMLGKKQARAQAEDHHPAAYIQEQGEVIIYVTFLDQRSHASQNSLVVLAVIKPLCNLQPCITVTSIHTPYLSVTSSPGLARSSLIGSTSGSIVPGFCLKLTWSRVQWRKSNVSILDVCRVLISKHAGLRTNL